MGILLKRKNLQRNVLQKDVVRRSFHDKNPSYIQIRLLGISDDDATYFAHSAKNSLRVDISASLHWAVSRFLKFDLCSDLEHRTFIWRENDSYNSWTEPPRIFTVFSAKRGLIIPVNTELIDSSVMEKFLGKRVAFLYGGLTDTPLLYSGRVNKVWDTGFRIMTDAGDYRSYFYARTEGLMKIAERASGLKILTFRALEEFVDVELANYSTVDPAFFYRGLTNLQQLHLNNFMKSDYYATYLREVNRLKDFYNKRERAEIYREMKEKIKFLEKHNL